METEIDGNYTLAELESCILLKEAAANELIALNNNADQANPLTLATFQKLGPGQRPKPIHVVESNATPPPGTNFVCSGIVFIKGVQTDVSAFRDA